MKLFHWGSSEVCRLYGSGDIIVMAESLEQARETALTQARTASLGYIDMADLQSRIHRDEDDRIEFEERLEVLRKDLKAQPRVYDAATAIFISGSE